MDELIIGVDLGASKVLIGLSDRHGEIIERVKFPTVRNRTAQEVIDEIVTNINILILNYGLNNEMLSGIAVAAPGPLTYPDGVVKGSPNLMWQNIHLREELRTRLGREIILEKDTNMAVLGEYYFGQDKSCEHLLYITVSTGVGGGLICGGRLYRGQNGGAGEIGHMIVNPGGARCGCGRYGCLEAEASGLAIARKAVEMVNSGKGKGILACCEKDDISSLEVGMAAHQGDPEALDIIEGASEYLAAGIANAVNMLNPEKIVLGGGVMFGLHDLMMDKIKKLVFNSIFSLHAENLDIQVSRLGSDIGILGCAAAVVHNQE